MRGTAQGGQVRQIKYGPPAGSLEGGRTFLTGLRLGRFATGYDGRFQRVLHQETARLTRALPRQSRSFGLARKALNMFLRDAFYNYDLRNHFGLGRARRLFEIPVDSVVAKELRRRCGPGVPVWPNLREVTPDVHARCQEAASDLARQLRIDRVHLDTILWVEGR